MNPIQSIITFGSRAERNIILLAILARIGSSLTADLSYLILTAYALRGKREVVQALTLSWLFTMLNTGLAPYSSFSTIGRYAVIFGSLYTIVSKGGFKFKDPFIVFTLFFGTYLIIHSILFSSISDVSILKAINWTLAVICLSSAWSGINSHDRYDLLQWIFSLLLLVAVLSIPFYAIPSIGMLRNGSGFQGVLNHPQAFGPTMAILGSFAVGYLLSVKNPKNWMALLFILSMILIYTSEARTAGVALVLSAVISATTISLLTGRPIRRVAPGLRSSFFAGFILTGLLSSILFGNTISKYTSEYLQKGDSVSGVIEAYDISRGEMIEIMLENFKDKPFTGIGFGIASEPSTMNPTRDPIFGIPLGASVEKGVLPVAVLEEIGIFGFVLTSVWVWMVLKKSAFNGLESLVFSSTALLMNMGEAILFSPGGMGMLMLVLLTYGATKSRPEKTPRVS